MRSELTAMSALLLMSGCVRNGSERFDLSCVGKFPTGEPFHENFAIDLKSREWCDLDHCSDARRSPIAKVSNSTITLMDVKVPWLGLSAKQTVDRATNDLTQSGTGALKGAFVVKCKRESFTPATAGKS